MAATNGLVLGTTARAVLTAVDLEPRATVRKLCEVVGLSSTSSVQEQLKSLQRRGLIEWQVCKCCGAAIRVVTEEASAYLLT